MAKKNAQFKIGETVVYPKHGVGEVVKIETMEVASIKTNFYVVKMEQSKLTIRVPTDKLEQVGLRKISSKKTIEDVFDILKLKPKIRRIMWSRRAQEYEAKISSGKIYELAEVVRDLNKGDDLMVDQSYSERQLFEKAYERILSEFKIILNISLEDTQKKLDKALKRNIMDQNKPISVEPKTTVETLSNEEPIADTEEPIEE